MAVLGVPHAAFANTIAEQQDNANGTKSVTLYSPHPIANQASTKNDGQNTTISLEAAGSSDIVTMRWEFSTDGGATWTNIGSVLTSPNDDGAWHLEWNPVADSGLTLPDANVKVRAVGHSNLDGLDHASSSSTMTVSSTFDTIAINDGSALGVWHANGGGAKVILSGSASTNFPNAQIAIADPGNGFDLGEQTLLIAAGKWKSVYDIEPTYASAPFGYNAPDQIVFNAVTDQVNPLSADSEGFTLYNQTIASITATHGTPPDNATAIPVTLTVKDQNGNPIAGVNVSALQGGLPLAALGTTDANGQVTTTQSVNTGTVQYVANAATGNQVLFDSGLGDKDTSLLLEAGHAASLVATSADGAAFDFDEQDGNDVQVQVKDQNGSNFDVPDTQDLTYHWKSISFTGETVNGTSHTVATDTTGKFDIPALNGADFPHGLESGTFELYASLGEGGTGHPVTEAKVLTVKAGEAAVRYTDPDGDGKVIAPVGTTAHVQGQLVLEDGTGLPGRKVDVNMALGTEFDGHGNTTGTPDAVITSNDPDTTGANGSFTVDVEDLSTDPNETEVGGEVQAFSAVSSFGDWLGDANQAGEGPEPYTEGVDFVANSAPAGSVLSTDVSATAGPAGSAAIGTLHLETANGDDLAGVQVNLTLDHGYFINNNHPFIDPVEGAYVPEFDSSLGNHLTVSTDSSGDAFYFTSIGRDSGFDDDGKVDAKVTASVTGASSANDSTTWSSDNPFNVSEISVVKTPDADQDEPTDPAPLGGPGVYYDVFAKDQFGNPARGVEVQVDCAVSDDADCPTFDYDLAHDGYGVAGASDLDNGGDIALVGNEAGDFHLTATVTGGLTPDFFGNSTSTTEVWDADGTFVGLIFPTSNPVEKAVTTTFEQTFYEVDETQGHYAISADPGTQNVPTDAPVTVTVNATDQVGNPLAGMEVDFVRTSDADNDQVFFTDGSGEAQYVFQGTDQQCGSSETVTAVVRDPNTQAIVKTLNITIHFKKCAVDASLSGQSSQDGKKDILKVTATTADGGSALTGTPVTLMAKINGHWTHVGIGGDVLNSNGKVKITVKDRNGDHVTKYKAMIDEHGRNQATTTNKARVR
ncbi:Ig-like domain-containing protein [Nocardioides panacisoli]